MRALASELERAMREYVRWVLERDVGSAGFIDTVRLRRPTRARGIIDETSALPAP